MRFGSCVALSVVTCSLLVGTDYVDWNNTLYQGGDNVNINYNVNPVLLTQGITIASGTLSASIVANNGINPCGSVGCFNTAATIGGAGKVDFMITNTNMISVPAFGVNNTLTLQAGLNFRSNQVIDTVFNLNNGTLNIQSSFEVSGGRNAIRANNSNLILKPANGKNINIQGNISLTGGRAEIELKGSNQKIIGDLTGAGSTIDAKFNNGAFLEGNLVNQGTLNLGLEGGMIKGNVNNNGTTALNLSRNAYITQDVTTQGNQLTLNLDQSQIKGNLTSTSATNQINLNNSAKILEKLTTNGQNNTITIDSNSSVGNGFESNGTTNLTINSGGKITGDSQIQGRDFTLNLNRGSMLGSLSSTATINNITLENNSIIRDDVTTQGNQLTLGLNQSRIGGNLTSSANTNQITLQSNSTIAGKVTTDGMTNQITGEGSQILGGLENKKGNLNFNFDRSSIAGGIISEGVQTDILLNNASNLTGGMSLAALTSTVLVQNNSHAKGGITFGGNQNSLEVLDTSTVEGMITIDHGTSNLAFKDSAKLTGGIDTNVGAGQSTITFEDSAQFLNGTSNFNALTNLTFSNNAQMSNEVINIHQSTSTIHFENSALMNGGMIHNQGGTLDLQFKNTAQMTNGIIQTSSGNTNLLAKDNASLSNKIIQNGGNNQVDFINSAQFSGDILQKDGTSQINFSNDSKMIGKFTQENGTSNIHFSGNASLSNPANTGGVNAPEVIYVTKGTTEITFNDQAKVVGSIKALGNQNTVTFTKGTMLDGDLMLDGLGEKIDGNSKVTLTGTRVTGNIQGYDRVDILINDQTVVDGWLHQGGSYIQPAMTATLENAWIKGGFEGSKNSENTLTMAESKIDNAVKQHTGKLTLTTNQSEITGGFLGTDADPITGKPGGPSHNKITTTDSTIRGGVHQENGTLKMNNTNTSISGGFLGDKNSENTIISKGGELIDGIKQDTGKLNLRSNATNYAGGFRGINSENVLQILNGTFGNGDIHQSGGKLSGEIIGLGAVRDVKGDQFSKNKIHLINTEVRHVDQKSGTLEFVTDSKVRGNITGSMNSANKISITGAQVKGEVSQNTGSMRLELNNATVNENVKSTDAIFELVANNATIKKNLELIRGSASGVSSHLTLEGHFSQTGGKSELIFSNTTFGETILNNANAALTFTSSSQIQNVTATGGIANINLTNSTMKNFSGTNGRNTFVLVESVGEIFTQNGGFLDVSGSSQSTITSVTGNNKAEIVVNLNKSNVLGNIKNDNGNTTISLQDAKIGGDVLQIGENMSFNATDSKLKGKYKQENGEINPLNLIHSKIYGGIDLEGITQGFLSFDRESEVLQGLSMKGGSKIDFTLLGQSQISGAPNKGISQIGGELRGSIDGESQINDGLELNGGITNLSLFNQSKINGDIRATNNETTLLVDHSQINGNISVTGAFLHLTAQNNSTITAPQMQITNADLKLIVDTNSSFIGDLNQTGHEQEVQIKQDSVFDGNITNTGTTGSIVIDNATLTGNLTQDTGTLTLILRNKGVIGGNVTLSAAQTTLGGMGTNNKISGNFEQNNGSLNGALIGLTLQGTYTQINGDSAVGFINSTFEKDTQINNANSSSLTFDHSTLKNYTITGGLKNTLKLFNQSTLDGNLSLKDQSKSILQMENSVITGDILGIRNSELSLNTKNSTIQGNIHFDTGGIKGQTSQTNINGNLILENTESEVSFTQNTIIGGDVTITGGENILKFDDSEVKGGVSAEGGKLHLDLSNGSKITQDVMLIDSDVKLTGAPAGNEILGNFTTKASALGQDSKLSGEISSLMLQGTFTQEFGESEVTFKENSLFKGLVSLTDAISAHLKFVGNSGINNAVKISGGENQISLTQDSFIKGNITVGNQSNTTISATAQSLIVGNLTSTNPKKTSVILSDSSFDGNIKQVGGEFVLEALGSEIVSSTAFAPNGIAGLDLNGVNATVKLQKQSNYSTSIEALNSSLLVSLSDSKLNSPTAETASLKDSNLSLIALSSSVGLNLTQDSLNAPNTLMMDFSQSSIFSGMMELRNIEAAMVFDTSKLLSNRIVFNGGKLDLKFKNAKHDVHREIDPEVVHNFEASGVEARIGAYGQSHAQIVDTKFTDSKITFDIQEYSRFESPLVTLDGQSEAVYQTASNGVLNINTHIANNAVTLRVDSLGGVLQGAIIQNRPNPTGEVRLGKAGSDGGRWAVTGDSAIKTLFIENAQDILESGAIFAPVFNTPMSFVDFTMEFDDHDKSTRIGKELVAKPAPLPDGTIPPEPPHQSYARVLKMKKLSGDSGVFRVYVDLQTKMADKIIAEEASGNHFIQAYYRPDTFKEGGGNEIVVAKVEDPNTQASFKGIQSQVGLTRYDTEIIKQNAKDGRGFEWVIGQITPAGMSHSSKIIASILQSQYRAFSVEIDSLDRRLGGLESIQREQGFWVRSFVGRGDQKATNYSVSATDDYYSLWGGYDFNSRGLTVHNYLGLFFNYTGLNTESKDYTAKSSNIAFGFYNTFRAYSGFYLDVLAKYIYTMSEFEISNYALAKNKPKFNNHKLLANLEMGYTFYLGERRKSSYIEPQFQITSGYTQGIKTSFLDVSGENIEANLGESIPVMMRWGVFYGKMFGESIKSDLRIGTSLAYDVNSGGHLKFRDTQAVFQTKQKGDFRMMLSAQADFYFTDYLRAYVSFDTSFFGKYSTLYNANFGLRFIFGKRNDRVAPVPMVYNPYTPPEPPKDPRNVPVIQDYTVRDIDTNYQGRPRAIRPRPESSQNPNFFEGYTPQPQSRKTYRDETIIINPNNPYQEGNQ